MLKQIFGWILIVLGLIFAIAGALANAEFAAGVLLLLVGVALVKGWL